MKKWKQFENEKQNYKIIVQNINIKVIFMVFVIIRVGLTFLQENQHNAMHAFNKNQLNKSSVEQI